MEPPGDMAIKEMPRSLKLSKMARERGTVSPTTALDGAVSLMARSSCVTILLSSITEYCTRFMRLLLLRNTIGVPTSSLDTEAEVPAGTEIVKLKESEFET